LQVKIQLRKTSLIDYPGLVSSVFFFYGCNLRCPWCQNRELIIGEEENFLNLEAGLAHLKKRKAVLGGAVLSGGEPCLYGELPDLVNEIKKLRLKVKLDTNGMFPAMLEKLICSEESRPDYIALDLKIAPSRYAELLPAPLRSKNIPCENMPEQAIIQSAALIRESGIPHEYRSIALPGGFITEKDIEELAPLADMSQWYFRPFSSGSCLDPAWNNLEESLAKTNELLKSLSAKAKELGKSGVAINSNLPL
jgi:pyruvate formate lyase activating enzyme